MIFWGERVVDIEAFFPEKMLFKKALIIAVKCISRGKKEREGKKTKKIKRGEKKTKKERKGKKNKKKERKGKCILPQFGRSGLFKPHFFRGEGF